MEKEMLEQTGFIDMGTNDAGWTRFAHRDSPAFEVRVHFPGQVFYIWDNDESMGSEDQPLSELADELSDRFPK